MILSLFLLYSLHGRAEGLTIKPTNSGGTITSGTDYTYINNILTVQTTTPVTIDGNSSSTTDRIVVSSGTEATITLKDVLIDVSSQNNACAFDIQGNASVALILEGGNTLKSGSLCDGIHCETNSSTNQTASITIQGKGLLTVVGGDDSWNQRGGAGIGGNKAGKIRIIGGTITATGGSFRSAIGGCVDTPDPKGDIIIAGGTVTATGGTNAPGISSSFSTNINGQPGNAFIISSGNLDKSNEQNWSGVLYWGLQYYDNSFKVYGTPTLGTDATIPNGKNLTIESGKILTVGKDVTLTNSGTLTNNGTLFIDGGTFTNNGTCRGSGKVLHRNGTINGSGSSSITAVEGVVLSFNKNAPDAEVTNMPSDRIVIEKGGTPVLSTPVRTGYTFSGWSTEAFSTTPITDWATAMNEDKTLYALWKYNPVITFSNTNGYSFAYGETPATVSVTVTGANGTITNPPITYAYYKNSGLLDTPPTAAGNYTVKASFAGDENNMATSKETTYTITQKTITVNVGAIMKVYDGETTVGLSGFTLDGVLAGDQSAVSLNTDNYSLAYASKEVASAINLTSTGTLSLSGGKSGNYKLTQPNNLTGAITAKELTVTPVANQSIYSDEHPAYTVSGAVGAEQPAFTGNLKVDNAKVVDDNLTLTDDEASGFLAANYTWALSSSDVTITQDSRTLAQVYENEANRISGAVGTGWHKADVVLTPSPGFKIKGSSTLRSSSDDWKDQLTVDGVDGIYNVTYSLLREGRTTASGNQSFVVNLDKTAPTVTSIADKLTLTVALSDATSGLASCTYDWNGKGDKSETLTPGVKSHSFTLTAPSAGSYPLKIVLTDQAGNETTYNKTVTLTVPDKPVDPPVGPSEPEVTYTVTLPAVEGAATDPAAGNYEVTGWSNFGFLLTLDAAYNQSVPIVTTDRGETIEPRASDGKYIIKRVRSDVSVSISGIVKNPDPVANEELSSPALRIYTAEGILCLDVPTVTEAWLITADGRLLRSLTLSPGLNRVYGLREGVYIVRLKDGTTRKVRVG